MTCPKCHCAECEKERSRWVGQTLPNGQQAVPNSAGYWHCGCGMWHPNGYTCVQMQMQQWGAAGGTVGGTGGPGHRQ
jgi:hypothetical protein